MKKLNSSNRGLFVLGNLLLVAVIIGYIASFTVNLRRTSMAEERQRFVENTDTVKSMVADYMDMSCRSVRDWKKLLSHNKWSAEEGVHHLDEVNSDEEIMAQILYTGGMNGFSSVASDETPGDYRAYYWKYANLTSELRDFAAEAGEDDVHVTGAFTNYVNAQSSIAFVMTTKAGAAQDDALLMRVEPVTRLQNIWSVYNTYVGAEVSMINAQGDYVYRAASLKNENFYEFLRSYNDLTFPQAQELKQTVASAAAPGCFVFNNSRGVPTLYAYSSSGENGWTIIRSIELKQLQAEQVQWSLLAVSILLFTILLLYDAHYFLMLNRRLRVSLQDLRKANSAKTQFLSTMSHDIRTPLNAILGMTEIAERNMDDPARVEECLRKVSLAGRHLLTLINDILDISQIESGRLCLNPAAFDLAESAEDLVNIIYPQAVEKNLQCEIHLENITQEWLYADKLRLNQIWINILSNAVKYTPEGGRIDIYLSERQLPDDPEQIELSFRAADTGIGMTEEFQKRLFEAFVRAKDSRTDTVEGSGLGMAITYQIVELLGGTIRVESEPGKGSTFFVTLRLQKAAELPPGRPLRGKRVLLAGEDMRSSKEFLESLGAQATIVTSGAAEEYASAARDDRRYDAAIVDRRMAQRDCLETAQALRQAAGDAPFTILISAFDVSDIESEAASCGVDGFLPRPLFRSALIEPLRGQVQTPHEKPEGQEPQFAGLHMLVAEDNEINWEIVQEMLKTHAITADRAADGLQCVQMLEKADTGTYDLVLMDIQMPGMDGLEAARSIRAMQDKEKAQVPILAMTANAFAEDVAACREAGMNGHVAKPVDWNTLFVNLKSIMGRE